MERRRQRQRRRRRWLIGAGRVTLELAAAAAKLAGHVYMAAALAADWMVAPTAHRRAIVSPPIAKGSLLRNAHPARRDETGLAPVIVLELTLCERAGDTVSVTDASGVGILVGNWVGLRAQLEQTHEG
jgi:hypothetical protein